MKRAPILLFFWAILALTTVVYWSGLKGAFIFDDYWTLERLGQWGEIDSVNKVLLFVTSGDTGPTGRPLALLSFLLNDNRWPTDPWGFKYTNLMVHLLISVLVFQLFRMLLQVMRHPRADSVALLGMALWVFHPLHVSTTLYVVQRMTQLATLWSVVGLMLYVRSRLALEQGARFAHVRLSLSIIGPGLLATYSKESGALLPLLAAVIEMLILRPNLNRRPNRIWDAAFFAIPALGVTAYLVSCLSFETALRGYSSVDRATHQPVVILRYLYDLIIPKMQYSGLYYGEAPPPRTAAMIFQMMGAAAGIALLIGMATRVRTRQPVLASAVLFFFAGHLLESTTVNLDPYYEHRNYLPSIFLTFAASYYLSMWVDATRRLAGAMVCLILVIYLAATYQNAVLWGNPVLAAEVWAKRSPQSIRAQLNAASMLQFKDLNTAIQHLDEGLRFHPEEPGLWVNRIVMNCQRGRLDSEALSGASEAYLRSNRPGYSFAALEHLATLVQEGQCKVVSLVQIDAIIHAAQENSVVRNSVALTSRLQHLLGRFALYGGKPTEAERLFRQVALARQDIETATVQAAMLATQGRCRAALEQLDLANKFTVTPVKVAPLSLGRLLHLEDVNQVETLRGAIIRGCRQED